MAIHAHRKISLKMELWNEVTPSLVYRYRHLVPREIGTCTKLGKICQTILAFVTNTNRNDYNLNHLAELELSYSRVTMTT